ncbi:hypothetical protein ACMD2_24939 [Ananas comosus]|uniref:Uncharacterized protein n=1 Tax=Ananas comosus TaxID=4615 RepID=A0A199UZ65_ANACO|nr:hypothetical protein ACMD2_24939 [Ananas comosus]
MSSGDPIDHLGLRNVVLFTNPSSIPNCGSSLLFLCCFLCLFSAKLSSNSDDGLREITIDTGIIPYQCFLIEAPSTIFLQFQLGHGK